MFYNSLLNIKDNNLNPVFQTWKNNLDSDGSFDVYNDVINESYYHLPYEFRNADLMMIPGAYKIGSIACCTSVGSIYELGFSRNSNSYGKIYNTFTAYSIDEPVLDTIVGYKPGYIISGVNNNAVLNNRLNGSPYAGGGSLIAPGNINDYAVFVEDNINSVKYINLGTLFPSPPYNRTVKFVIKKHTTRCAYFQVMMSGDVGLVATTFNLANGDISTHYSTTVSSKEWLYDKDYWEFTIKYSVAGVPYGPELYITDLSFNPTFLGDGVTEVHIREINSIADESLPILHYNDATSEQRELDILDTITLSSNAKVFIKTLKGGKIITLPALSVLDLNTHVVNDKLICFAIKYI